MASSSGSGAISSASSGLEDVKAMLDQRKRKRMLSNRESARRSRMRKQKHLDDLLAQVAQLTKDNNLIFTNLNITTQHFASIDAENSILKAQVDELSNRLHSLNDIISLLNINGSNGNRVFEDGDRSNNGDLCNTDLGVDGFFNHLQMPFYMNQPLMASADMFQDY